MNKRDQRVAFDETVDGVRTIVLHDWRAFHELMIAKHVLADTSLIWRGQKRGDSPGWTLRPRLDRDFPSPVPDPGEDDLGRGSREAQERREWALRYVSQLERFKAAAAGRRGVNPRNLDGPKGEEGENDEWWALGQHYGLHTPLLDWTESPFAALFFAFLEDSTAERIAEPYGQHYRYLFALDRSAIELWNAERRSERQRWLASSPIPMPTHIQGNPESVERAYLKQEEQRRERLYFPKIRLVRPNTDENLRLLSQGGMFTQAPPGKDVEAFVRETFKDPSLSAELAKAASPWMLKFKIPEDDQQDCLVALNRMAINHRTLFPDLSGASLYVNMSIENPSY